MKLNTGFGPSLSYMLTKIMVSDALNLPDDLPREELDVLATYIIHEPNSDAFRSFYMAFEKQFGIDGTVRLLSRVCTEAWHYALKDERNVFGHPDAVKLLSNPMSPQDISHVAERYVEEDQPLEEDDDDPIDYGRALAGIAAMSQASVTLGNVLRPVFNVSEIDERVVRYTLKKNMDKLTVLGPNDDDESDPLFRVLMVAYSRMESVQKRDPDLANTRKINEFMNYKLP